MTATLKGVIIYLLNFITIIPQFLQYLLSLYRKFCNSESDTDKITKLSCAQQDNSKYQDKNIEILQ